ncbi:MAG: tRNA (adenine(22)-N(1))-methyltransferase [Bacillota bacterium]
MAYAVLPPRLDCIANKVPPGSVVADIGTDHAYLPISLVLSGRSPRAIGSDTRPSPLAAAVANVMAAGVAGQVELRRGSGLSVLTPGEVDVVVIAGLGGVLTCRILEADPVVRFSVERFVLQPNIGAEVVRRWLEGNQLKLADEDLVEDEGRLYEVIVAEPRTGSLPSPDDQYGVGREVVDLVGPLLLKRGHPLLRRHAETKLGQFRKALDELRQAKAPRAAEVRARYQRIADGLAEVLRCLPKS